MLYASFAIVTCSLIFCDSNKCTYFYITVYNWFACMVDAPHSLSPIITGFKKCLIVDTVKLSLRMCSFNINEKKSKFSTKGQWNLCVYSF